MIIAYYTDTQRGGKDWKRQWYGFVNIWNKDIWLWRWRKCIDGRENRLCSNRKVNAGYILEELGKAAAKRGDKLAEKWCFSTESRYENGDTRRNGNRRLQRQRYGALKENALLGNFRHAPQTHYKPLPMKPKCLWCVVKIWRWRMQFSSVWNTAVRCAWSDCIATKLIHWKKSIQWL